MILIVMGISGAGKSTLGRALAQSCGWDFIEGDDYHPPQNIEKMRRGEPLNHQDRWPWLERLHWAIAGYAEAGDGAVVACSALKKAYRDQLVRGLTNIRFVFLCGNSALIRERLSTRDDHFMPPELLDSQIAALEPPVNAVFVPIHHATHEQVADVERALNITARP